MLDNASNNNSAIKAIADKIDFTAAYRCLCCAPHTLNLVGQTLLWGNNQDAYNNNKGNL
jgi:hypothetical protein